MPLAEYFSFDHIFKNNVAIEFVLLRRITRLFNLNNLKFQIGCLFYLKQYLLWEKWLYTTLHLYLDKQILIVIYLLFKVTNKV